jgi:hypothetical protein
MLYKNSVRTSKRTPHFTITEINWLTLFKEIIAVYSENHAKAINKKFGVTDYQSRWFIYLPLGPKGLMYQRSSSDDRARCHCYRQLQIHIRDIVVAGSEAGEIVYKEWQETSFQFCHSITEDEFTEQLNSCQHIYCY